MGLQYGYVVMNAVDIACFLFTDSNQAPTLSHARVQIHVVELNHSMLKCVSGTKPFNTVLNGKSRQASSYRHYNITTTTDIPSMHDLKRSSNWIIYYVYTFQGNVSKCRSTNRLNKPWSSACFKTCHLYVLSDNSFHGKSVKTKGLRCNLRYELGTGSGDK